MRKMKADGFARSLLVLAIPLALQNLFSAAVNSADVIMLSYVSQDALAAVSLANQIQFILQLFYLGMTLGIGVLVAQYWGKKDRHSIEKIMGIALKFSVIVSLLFTIVTFFFSEQVMQLFTKEAELIEIGSLYLRVISFTYLCTGVSQVYLAVIRSMERVKKSTLISSAPLVLNVILNALFIFGWLGFPKLGVFGVALATLISRIVEVLWCVLDSMLVKKVCMRASYILHADHLLLKDFIKFSSPAILQGLMFGTAFSMYSVIMGHMGSDMVAANSIVTVVRNFANIICNSLAAGGSILIGKELGAMLLNKAKKDARKLWMVAIGFGVLGGMLILLIRPFVLDATTLEGTAKDYLGMMLFINSYYVIGHAVNITFMDIFSAGGDTKFGMFCDGIVMWLIALPICFIAAFVLKLPPMVVYVLICLDEFIKIPACILHYRRQKWLKNITRESS